MLCIYIYMMKSVLDYIKFTDNMSFVIDLPRSGQAGQARASVKSTASETTRRTSRKAWNTLQIIFNIKEIHGNNIKPVFSKNQKQSMDTIRIPHLCTCSERCCDFMWDFNEDRR